MISSSIKPPFFYKLSLILMVTGKLWLWPTQTLFESWVPGVCLGVPIFVAGVYVAIDSKKAFKKTGTPMMGRASSTSPLHTSGYFSYTRNPMYLGISVALLGAALISNCSYNLLFPLVNAAIMNEYYIPEEEQQLDEAFGSKYLTYKESVPRWL